MAILKLDHDDEKQEMEFEIACALQVNPDERLRQWLEWNMTMIEFMRAQSHDLKDTAAIIKRP